MLTSLFSFINFIFLNFLKFKKDFNVINQSIQEFHIHIDLKILENLFS